MSTTRTPQEIFRDISTAMTKSDLPAACEVEPADFWSAHLAHRERLATLWDELFVAVIETNQPLWACMAVTEARERRLELLEQTRQNAKRYGNPS